MLPSPRGVRLGADVITLRFVADFQRVNPELLALIEPRQVIDALKHRPRKARPAVFLDGVVEPVRPTLPIALAPMLTDAIGDVLRLPNITLPVGQVEQLVDSRELVGGGCVFHAASIRDIDDTCKAT